MEKKSPIDLLDLDNLSKLVQNVTQDLQLVKEKPQVKKWRYLTPDESTLMTQRAMGCKPEDEIKMNPGWADRVIPMETLVKEVKKEDEKKEDDSDEHPLLEDKEEEKSVEAVESLVPTEQTTSEDEDSSDETSDSDSEGETEESKKKSTLWSDFCTFSALLVLVLITVLLYEDFTTPIISEFDELSFYWNPALGMSAESYIPYELKDPKQVRCQTVKGIKTDTSNYFYTIDFTAAVVLKQPAQNGTASYITCSHIIPDHEPFTFSMIFSLEAPTKVLILKGQITRSIFDLPITVLKITVAPSDDLPYEVEVPCSDVEARNEAMLEFATGRGRIGRTLVSYWSEQ